MELKDWRDKFAQVGVNVVGMTYDSLAALVDFHDGQGLGYPLLRDVEAEHMVAFGVLNEDYAPGDRAYGIPHPGILYIDANGLVKAKYAIPGYRKRPPLEQVLADVQAAD